MILNTSNLCKAFGEEEIINNASIIINENERVAVVGANGAGKTTLLRMLTGELAPDSGSVHISKNTSVGYLRQINDIDSDLSIEEELLTVIKPITDMENTLKGMHKAMKGLSGEELESLYDSYTRLVHEYELADGYAAKSRVTGILKGLGFSEDEFSKKINMLSGGQKTRVFLGKLLLSKPNIIMLDEPTNHLDLSSIEWLENYLLNYKGTVIIVSHDRYFLDRIVNKVIDLEACEALVYSGNYTEFTQKKALLKEAALKAYANQQEEIKRQEAVIDKLKSFNREKSVRRAESRQKMLDKIDKLDKPTEPNTDMKLDLTMSRESGNDVLRAENLEKAFNNHTLFSGLSFEIKRGEHVAIIGDNGSGKTTILKIINNLLLPDKGYVQLGIGVETSYYDQEHQVLNQDKTLFDELQDAYPELDNTSVRNVLAAFLFTGNEVFKKISSLSGGERGRVSLAKLMLGKANFIVLDEPTNHLDTSSKEILESAIKNFKGTVLYVSHDRYFINQTADRILELKDNKLYNYIGNYDYYLEKRDDVRNAAFTAYKAQNISAPLNEKKSKQDWLASKEKAAKAKKQKAALENCESLIEKYENEIREIELDFAKPEFQSDAVKLMKLQKQKEAAEAELEKLYTQWEVLSQ